MKILIVSMNSIHFIRWTEQLKDSGHDIFWFDILEGGPAARLSWVTQITGWKHKFKTIKGRHYLKKHWPKTYKFISPLVQHNTAKVFEKALQEIQPDIVHSIVLYISCTPILEIMQKYNTIPWVYSSWGSDLYYYKNIPSYRKDILKVLPRINYLISDCKRDTVIAKDLGFKNKVLGVFPGGGGFNFEEYDKYIKPLKSRNIILIKGYQGRSGKAIEILKALELIPEMIKPFDCVVFGADKEVIQYIESKDLPKKFPIRYFSRSEFLPHKTILKLMGDSLIYIGNSDSDGMPNTLLEAIVQGAFPIQSNPGGVSEEVINDSVNGLLIQDCNDIVHISELIKKAITTPELIVQAFKYNQNQLKPKYNMNLVKGNVLKAYNSIKG